MTHGDETITRQRKTVGLTIFIIISLLSHVKSSLVIYERDCLVSLE